MEEFNLPTFEEHLNERSKGESRPGYMRSPKKPKKFVTYKGDKYEYTLVKTEKGSKYESPMWGLIVLNTSTKEFIAWRDVWSYTRGYSQGTNRSEEQWFLNTRELGVASNGSGQDNATTPYYVDGDVELILRSFHEDSYLGSRNWYTQNAKTYGDGEKLSVVKSDLK